MKMLDLPVASPRASRGSTEIVLPPTKKPGLKVRYFSVPSCSRNVLRMRAAS